MLLEVTKKLPSDHLNLLLSFSSQSTTVAEQGFPPKHTVLPNFSKNCMKLKEFGPQGRAGLPPPLRSATELCKLSRELGSVHQVPLTTSKNKNAYRPLIDQGRCTCLGCTCPEGVPAWRVYLPRWCTCPGVMYLPGGVPGQISPPCEHNS